MYLWPQLHLLGRGGVGEVHLLEVPLPQPGTTSARGGLPPPAPPASRAPASGPGAAKPTSSSQPQAASAQPSSPAQGAAVAAEGGPLVALVAEKRVVCPLARYGPERHAIELEAMAAAAAASPFVLRCYGSSPPGRCAGAARCHRASLPFCAAVLRYLASPLRSGDGAPALPHTLPAHGSQQPST